MTAGAAAGDCEKFQTRMPSPQNNDSASAGITTSLKILKAAASWYKTISTDRIHLAVKDIYFNYNMSQIMIIYLSKTSSSNKMMITQKKKKKKELVN